MKKNLNTGTVISIPIEKSEKGMQIYWVSGKKNPLQPQVETEHIGIISHFEKNGRGEDVAFIKNFGHPVPLNELQQLVVKVIESQPQGKWVPPIPENIPLLYSQWSHFVSNNLVNNNSEMKFEAKLYDCEFGPGFPYKKAICPPNDGSSYLAAAYQEVQVVEMKKI